MNDQPSNGLYNLSANGMYVLSIKLCSCYVWVLHDLFVNFLYDLFVNGMFVLSIDVCPRDIRDLHELSVNGINSPSFHVRSCGLRESGDVTSESGIHVPNILNDIGEELALNGLNGLNGIGSESAQEYF